MNKFLASFLAIQLVLLPVIAYAEDTPRVHVLKKGTRAPFDGVLLNAAAQKKQIAEKKEAKRNCDLRVQYLTMRGKADCKLQRDLSTITRNALEGYLKSTIKIKDEEIERLHKIALKNPNSNAKWWLMGGVVVGVLVTIGTFILVAKVEKTAQ